MHEYMDLVWTDWDNWYETGVKLTWSWHTTGLAVYIYVIHILSYSFFWGGKRFCRGVGLFMTNWSSKNRTSLYSTPRDTWPLSYAAASHACVLENARFPRSASAPCSGGLSSESPDASAARGAEPAFSRGVDPFQASDFCNSASISCFSGAKAFFVSHLSTCLLSSHPTSRCRWSQSLQPLQLHAVPF